MVSITTLPRIKPLQGQSTSDYYIIKIQGMFTCTIQLVASERGCGYGSYTTQLLTLAG